MLKVLYEQGQRLNYSNTHQPFVHLRQWNASDNEDDTYMTDTVLESGIVTPYSRGHHELSEHVVHLLKPASTWEHIRTAIAEYDRIAAIAAEMKTDASNSEPEMPF